MSDKEGFCMQVHASKAVLHRHNSTTCKVVKAWRDHAEKSKGYMGYIRPVDWAYVEDKAGAYRRCTACFPPRPPRDERALDVEGYREFLREELNRSTVMLSRWLDEPETWASKDQVKLADTIAREVTSVGDHILSRYHVYAKLSIEDKWVMLGVTRDLFQEFLGHYAALDPKVYELLRTQVAKGLMEFHHVKVLLNEGGLDPLWLAKSFPTREESEREACSKLNAEISRVLAGFGIVPCNGRNHPFFCFCGFGGTRLSGSR